MTRLYDIQDNIDMSWCRAWINNDDESKYIISLDGRNALTGADVTADDLEGYYSVTCNKCPRREQCEQMEVHE